MAIATIKDFDNKLFELNGIKYVRNFIAIKIGSNVRISNAYDSRFTLVIAHYTEYLINGNVYTSADDVVSVLSPILFVKDELSMADSGEAGNTTVTAKFTNINGNWVNTPSTPGSGNIILDLTNSKNGAVCALYYLGSVINKTIFIGGVIVFLSGINRLNELCLVFIIYDKGSNSFSVNILDGATGDLPAPSDAPAQMEITEMIDETGGADTTNPEQMLITDISQSDILSPEQMEITDILIV